MQIRSESEARKGDLTADVQNFILPYCCAKSIRKTRGSLLFLLVYRRHY